ncbi:MAG: glycosyl transferase [Epsilonproteobacteria bacterium]|nr:glycosyl transferase [Campylobacterota bacterium]NPA64229.1 glycosyltransferase [Campylobacterota bacterium]
MASPTTSPLFSVIIPVFNREGFIARAIESVLAQTFQDFELIVVDDGSTDQSAAIASRYPITLIRQPNRGVSSARNAGIQASHGKIVAFLDSDDLWKPKKLEAHHHFFQENPDFKIHQTDEIWIRKGKFLNKKKIHQKKEGFIFYDSLHLCLISPSAVAIKKELFDEVGLFDESFEVCEDYELWLRITKRYPVGFTPEPLVVKYGGHGDQLSQKYYGMDRWRVKAMLPFCDDPKVLEVAIKKCEILLKGAKKHNNQEIIEEFGPIYHKLLTIIGQ